MSTFDEKMSLLKADAAALGLYVDEELFTRVAKALGPSLYQDDASLVSVSDPDEMARVKQHFLTGKLGITDAAAMDAAISEVVAQFGKSNRNKHRAIFYYLLVEKFGKAAVYSD